MNARALLVTFVAHVAAFGVGHAQSVERRDTLRLAELQDAAARLDPRERQLALERQATALRLRTIGADRLPSLSGEGYGQYQSVVVALPFQLPNVPFSGLPHDTYDAHLLAQQRLFDPSLGPRANAERANLAVNEARIRTNIYALHDEVNSAFFSAALAQARSNELTTVIADLEAQLRVAQARVREGTALPSEPATIEAELMQRRQDRDDVATTRNASLAVLSSLTGRQIAPSDTILLPDIGAAVAEARTAIPRARPEYAQFARARDQLAAQERVVATQTRPQVSAYGRFGYGKPGLNFLATDFNSYWIAGVRVQWAPWTWGSNAREREVLEVQQQIVASDLDAFTASQQRAVERQLADIDRLTAALRTDDSIIALRERIERETQHRYTEAVVTAAEFVDRRNDVLAARLTRVSHEVELAQARARFLTTVGLEAR
ncbi:MAG TPA: TolC family protein [Gemmatimonadaceae bacterium]|nr:TolC family protein [Gemmatimonadaceae bacterium]